MISFNMTLSMPSLGYQANSLLGSGGLYGNGLTSGALGLPFGAGSQGILPAAFTSGAPGTMESQIIRMLLTRALTGGDGLGLTTAARTNGSDSSADTRLRDLDERIEKLEKLQKRVAEMDADTQLGVEAIAAMNRRLKRLEEDMRRANGQ
jgi:hypothetical protein